MGIKKGCIYIYGLKDAAMTWYNKLEVAKETEGEKCKFNSMLFE